MPEGIDVGAGRSFRSLIHPGVGVTPSGIAAAPDARALGGREGPSALAPSTGTFIDRRGVAAVAAVTGRRRRAGAFEGR
jgi:hypothetical protein